jgi:hypothetical protein
MMTVAELRSMPVPYGLIADYWKRADVVPFLGAGASLGPRPHDAVFDGGDPQFLPKGDELSTWLARRANFPKDEVDTDLPKVASYVELLLKRKGLATYLRKIFASDYPTQPIHELIADIERPMLIVTTNYDDLIEQAFLHKKRPFHVVAYPEGDVYAASVLWWQPGDTSPTAFHPNRLPLTLTDTSIIYKIHGTIRRDTENPHKWDSYVITEEDYVRFLSLMTSSAAIPKRLDLHMRGKSLLFLGYGLRDWNLRVMLEKLRSPNAAVSPAEAVLNTEIAAVHSDEDNPAWAIQYRPSPLELALWPKRGVLIYDDDLSNFAREIRKEMGL